MKKYIIVIWLLFITQYAGQNGITYLRGFPPPLLNGYGNSAIYNDVSNIGSMNPASLGVFNNVSLGFSYLFEDVLQMPMPDLWDHYVIEMKRINNHIPQSIGLVYPLGNLRLAISMNQKYNLELSAGPVPITEMDGSSQFFQAINRTTLNNYSITSSYTFENLLLNSNLSFGFRVGINKLASFNNLYNTKSFKSYLSSSNSYKEIDFSIGAVYENNFLKFGLSYESTMEFSELRHQKNSTTITTEVITVAEFPPTLRFDFEMGKINNMIILGSISNAFWSQISQDHKNQIELTSSVSYQFDELFTPSIGFIYSDVEDYSEVFKDLDGVFLIASATTKFSNMNIYISLADSHLFSGDWRKQTIFKIGAGYSL